MADDIEPGRPPVEAVFAALVATTLAGVAVAQVLARVLPPSADASAAASDLTLAVASMSFAFALAQAVLPGPKSAGCAGLMVPMAGAALLAVRGHEPAVVVAALFTGVFLTPASYYIAIRWSVTLRGSFRRRPFLSLFAAAAGSWLLWQALRLAIRLAG